jgi:hypothetical protein
MFEKLQELVKNRREKRANRLALPLAFWGQALQFGASFIFAISDGDMSPQERDFLMAEWRDLMLIAKNAREVKDANP